METNAIAENNINIRRIGEERLALQARGLD